MLTHILNIKHCSQVEDNGCLAACAQMVLAELDIIISQNELNHLFELTIVGVPLSRLKRLKRYGVQTTIQKEGNLNTLKQAVDKKMPPIIFVRTSQLSYWREDTQHAILVVGYDGSDLLLNDPAFSEGQQSVNADELMLAWDEFDNTYACLTL